MSYHHIILEPSMFNCLDFIVRAEDKARAYSKLMMWCKHQEDAIHKAMEGEKDQDKLTRSTRDYWACGIRNRAYMGILTSFPDFKPYAFIV